MLPRLQVVLVLLVVIGSFVEPRFSWGLQTFIGAVLGVAGTIFMGWKSDSKERQRKKVSHIIGSVAAVGCFWAIIGLLGSAVLRAPFGVVARHLSFYIAFSMALEAFSRGDVKAEGL